MPISKALLLSGTLLYKFQSLLQIFHLEPCLPALTLVTLAMLCLDSVTWSPCGLVRKLPKQRAGPNLSIIFSVSRF